MLKKIFVLFSLWRVILKVHKFHNILRKMLFCWVIKNWSFDLFCFLLFLLFLFLSKSRFVWRYYISQYVHSFFSFFLAFRVRFVQIKHFCSLPEFLLPNASTIINKEDNTFVTMLFKNFFNKQKSLSTWNKQLYPFTKI